MANGTPNTNTNLPAQFQPPDGAGMPPAMMGMPAMGMPQSPLPLTSPVPGAGNNISGAPVMNQADPYGLAQLSALQLQQILSSAPAEEASQAREQIAQLAAERQAMPLPHTGIAQAPWMQFQPITGQGGGHDLANLFKDIGRAGLLAAASTGPGRAMQATAYGPGEREYAEKQAGLASQIAALQARAEGAQQETQTLGQVAGRSVYAGARLGAEQMLTNVQLQRLDVLKTQIANNYSAKIQQISAEKDMNQKRIDAQVLAQQMRDETLSSVAGMQVTGRGQVEAVQSETLQSIANLKGADDPTVWGAITREFGLTIPQAPGGAIPTATQITTGGATQAAPTQAAPTQAGPPEGMTVPQGYRALQHNGRWGVTDGKQFLPYKGK